MSSNPNARTQKNERIKFRGECFVASANSSNIYTAEICEISQEDIIFSLKTPVFSARSLVEIKLRCDSRANITLLGMVKGAPESPQGSCNLYTVKFEHKLNEGRFKDIVLAFRPHAFDAWG